MKNIKLVIEYIGTKYCGFQRQKNGLSIQEVLEEAIKLATGETVVTYPSGRTDAGVHALGQVVNFFTNSSIQADKMPIVINYHLPNDIKVLSSCEVEDNFNARKSAIKKTYIYKIFNCRQLSVFDEGRAIPFGFQLDIDEMKKACNKFIGTHDFSSFVSTGTSTKSTIRTIYNCEINKENNYVYLTITGNGFLYNMVRIIVGTLLDIGIKKTSLEMLDTLLQGNNRKLAGRTVKPDGLYLKEVYY